MAGQRTGPNSCIEVEEVILNRNRGRRASLLWWEGEGRLLRTVFLLDLAIEPIVLFKYRVR